MNKQRKLLIGAVGIIKGKVKHDGKAMVEICDELEPLLESSDAFHGAPFKSISIIIRYGKNRSMVPELGKINKKYLELEVAFELPMVEVSKMNFEDLKAAFLEATLKLLTYVCDRYSLSHHFLDNYHCL
jgi:hypothetical protein